MPFIVKLLMGAGWLISNNTFHYAGIVTLSPGPGILESGHIDALDQILCELYWLTTHPWGGVGSGFGYGH